MAVTHPYAPPPAASMPAPAGEINLREYAQVLRKRRVLFAQVFAVVFAACLVVTFLTKPVYQTSAKLLVPPASASITMVEAANPFAGMMQGAQPDSVATQLQLLQSSPFLEEARKVAHVKARPGVMPPAVRAESAEGTQVIRITGEGGDPVEVAGMVNAVVDLHLSQTGDSQVQQLQDTFNFVKQEKEKAGKTLAAVEDALVRFRQQHRVVQLAADQEARAKDYVELQARTSELESSLEGAKAQLKELEAKLGKEPLDIVQESSQDNPRVAKLQEKLDDLTLQRSDMIREYKPTSRQVVALDAQIEAVKAQLQAEPKERITRTHVPNERRGPLLARQAQLEAEVQGYQASYNNTKAKLDAQKGMVDNLGPWQVKETRLVRDRDIAQSAYTSLSNQMRDLEIRLKARPRPAKLIEPAAVPTVPVRPNKATNIVFSLVLALCLAAGMAFLQEYLDDRISTPEDMERLSALPSLGQVPMLQPGQPRLVSALPGNTEVAESYRTLRSSIGFAGVEAPLRRILVTSSVPGEGKTVTAANLAAAMAMDGKRVILVDADMRRPTLNRVMELPQNPGLSELLINLKTVDQVLQPTELPGLQVISAGPIPPNPAELLGTRTFDQVLAQLEERCDVVILDSPPCLPVTDPLLIATRMDGVVLVAHVGQTKKADLRRAEELLQRARARIVGIVFNRVQQRGGRNHYYSSYYYYDDNGQGGNGPSGFPGADLNGKNGHGHKVRSPRRLPAGVGGRDVDEEDA